MWKTFLLLSIIAQSISSEDGGQSEVKGIVQACPYGKWGSVLDEGWRNEDAKVVCRQLGYSEESATAFMRVHYRPLNQDKGIHMKRCEGSEERLADCENYNTPRLLSLYEDVGVHCQPFLLDIPQNVTAAVETITSVAISWRSPSLHQNNTQLQYYVVCTASVDINNATYKHRVETKAETSTFTATVSNLLPSTAYKCCVSTGAHVPNPIACRSIMTGESADTSATTSNCSVVGGGLGALVVILVLLQIGSICIIVYLKSQQKIKASDPVNECHSTSTGNSLKKDSTLRTCNPSYNVVVPPSRNRNSSNEAGMPLNPSDDARPLYTELPPENSNNSQYSTIGRIHKTEPFTSTGTEGSEYSHLKH